MHDTERPPYYIMPGERLQELLERAHAGEDVGSLMAEEYEAGSSQMVEGIDDPRP